MRNPLLFIDGYKLDHRRQYPDGTERVYSNLTARSSRLPGVDRVVFFGLQHFLNQLTREFADNFFSLRLPFVLDEYRRRIDGYLGPNSIDLAHIERLHEIGFLPLEVCAVPEGTRVPLRVPMLTIENTRDDCAWLTNYLETWLSAAMWLPITSATQAFRLRQLLTTRARQTGADESFVPWQGHDFSFRGMSGVDAAAISGAAHLLAFTGTDTLPALDLIEEHYRTAEFIGGSVPATEHSVMSAGGSENERETFERLLDLYPTGIVSVVSDTWDLWRVLTETLPALRERILARDGKLVIRPDSGDPVLILCGDPSAQEGTPQHAGVIRLLAQTFGSEANGSGFQRLNPHVGAIYGDSISFERADAITSRLREMGFESTSVVLGVGSYTYQHVTRDTLGMAMKATWARVNGEGRDLWKKPVTDDGTKYSLRGRIAVLDDAERGLVAVDQATPDMEEHSVLRPVWRNGQMLIREGFDAIRNRVLAQLEQ